MPSESKNSKAGQPKVMMSGNVFTRVAVDVDGCAFQGNTFNDVTFRYNGGAFHWFPGNKINRCRVILNCSKESGERFLKTLGLKKAD